VVPLFGVGWTLNFEMFFYALFALALFGPRWSVVPGVIAVLTAMVITNALGLPAPPWLKFLSDPIVLEFAFGMLVALAYRRNVALPVWLRALMIVTGAIAVWFTAATMPPSHWRVIVWGLPEAVVVAGAVLGPPPPASRLTQLKTTLGDASYSIYLLHGLVGAALMRLWPYLTHRISLELAVAGAFFAMMVLSVGSYKLLERPATAAIKRALTPLRPAAGTA
jgi:exopolysaccharide production protein ExoZ